MMQYLQLFMSKADEIKVRNQEDIAAATSYIQKHLGLVIRDNQIKENYRLIKSDADQPQDPNRPPPLMIVFKDLEAKDAIFKNLYKLRGKKEITFSHDYTELEREENKKLQDEAKEKSKKEPGVVYRVRGPPWARKIVRITTREEVVEPQPVIQM